MEDNQSIPMPFGRHRIYSDADNVALLPTSDIPSIQVTSALDHDTATMRGRRHSRDFGSIEMEYLETAPDEESPDPSSTGVRTPSPKPSAAGSLLNRLTTMRSSGRRPWRQRSTHGGRYDTLDDDIVEPVPVDLSSLEGMGYALTSMRNTATAVASRLEDYDTTYRGSTHSSGRPDFQSFVRKTPRTPRLGDGMVIGAQLRRDPSRAAQQGSATGSYAGENGVQRAQTTRNVGQSLAAERNMMVAVTEQVDISSLEGSNFDPHASVQSLGSMPLANGEQPQSYFFPKDPDIPDWRPFSMRWPYIFTLAAVSLGLAIFQEWLYRHSQKKRDSPKGGLLAFDRASDVSDLEFFTWKYLPTLITITYAVLFSIMDFDIRRLEPYYQLSQPLGAKASASLNLDLMTMLQYFVPVKALRMKQWAVFFSTIGNVIASTAAPAIQNPSIMFVTNPDCPQDFSLPCRDGRKHYFVRVSSPWSRVLSSVLVLITAISVIIFFLLRRKSGLLSDPKGIAGIASMATKSHILNDFQGMDLATRGQIHKRLQHRRFVLYKSSIWQGEWSATSEPMQESEHRMSSPHPPMLRLGFGVPFLSFMVFGLVAVPLISLTGARIIPNTVPWLPILLATILKFFFSTFESDVRLMEPFYQLSRGMASPQQSLTLDYRGTVYGWIVIKAALNRHWLVSLVGLSSVLLDVLTVTVSSFSVNSGEFLRHGKGADHTSNQDETFASFWASVILSIAILTFVTVTTAFVYLLRRHPFLPREPSTIAAVLAFIYASNMLDDFIDTEKLTSKEVERGLKSTGNKYALGWFKGRDGQMHCAIDQEPIRSKYVHGKPYSMALAAPFDVSGDGGFV